MDWSRAKTILLVSFLLLNILLGYQLWYDKSGSLSSESDVNEATPEIEQIMALKDIRLTAEVPKETPKLREIDVRITPSNGEPPTVLLPTPFRATELATTSSVSAISNQIPDGGSYRLDEFATENSMYLLHQMHEAFPLFDVKLVLYEVEGVVTSYQQTHAEILTGAVVKEQKVLNGFTAIELLVEKYLKAGTTIIDVRLGYHGQTFDADTRVLAPYWRIMTDQGDRLFVHAITGAVEE